MEYVAGFLYSEDKQSVALIRKLKPEWQKGLLNGIGGKIEINETPLIAMIREFEEETNVIINDWRKFCELEGNNFIVHFFSAIGNLDLLESPEEEQVEIINIDNIPKNQIIPNLQWLIPMGIDPYHTGGYLHENITF